MPRLPLVVRVAAGLVAATVDELRNLPSTVVSLPVTAVSQVLQSFMRTQQQVTALAVRGDEVLSFLTPGESQPEWATFDEDTPPADGPTATSPPARPRRDGRFALYSQVPDVVDTTATARTTSAGRGESPSAVVAPISGYDTMTLAQLRARLRTLSSTELEDLLLHERSAQDRPPFLTMLSNRIATVRSQ